AVPQRSQPRAYDLGDTVERKAALETARRARSLSLRPHRPESRMRENRPSGSEGGGAAHRSPYPYPGLREPFLVAQAFIDWAISPRLKAIFWQMGRNGRLAIAVVAGMLLAAAFPSIGVAGFGWVAPGMILVAGMGVEGPQAFRLGYVAGLAHYLTSLSWLLHIPVMKLAPISGWLALSAFLALYPAMWVWLCWRIYPVRLRIGVGGVPELLGQFRSAAWRQRVWWALSCAALWVAWEMVQARLFTGFPWNFLGASQYQMLPLIQIASLNGVYGVSFLAAWFSVCLLCGAAAVLGPGAKTGRWMSEMLLPFVVLICVITQGYHEVMRSPAPDALLKVALVQPSIPQQ